MTNRKVYWGMIGVNVFLLLAVLGVAVMGDRLLKKQSDIIINQRLENTVLEKEQLSLIQAKKDLEAYYDLQKIAKQIVPQEKDQALTIRQIIALADKAGIKISNIGFPSSTLGSPTTKTTVEPGASPTTTTDISQAKPVTGIKGLLSLEMNITSDVTKPTSYSRLVSFLEGLENNRRTAQVSQLSIQPDNKDPSLLNFTLTLTVYIKP